MTTRQRAHILAGDAITGPAGAGITASRTRPDLLTPAERQAARIRAQDGTPSADDLQAAARQRHHRPDARGPAPAHAGSGVMTVTLTVPGRWAEQALCAQADPDAWFPRKGQATAVAKRICATCPVRAQCLDYALSGADTCGGISTGIWGGTTPRERARLRRLRQAAAA